jgi:hypothetical protein
MPIKVKTAKAFHSSIDPPPLPPPAGAGLGAGGGRRNGKRGFTAGNGSERVAYSDSVLTRIA